MREGRWTFYYLGMPTQTKTQTPETPAPQAETAKQRAQRKYMEKREKQGIKRVIVDVPADQVSTIKRVAKALRDGWDIDGFSE